MNSFPTWRLIFLILFLALLNLAVDGHRKVEEMKCNCDEENQFQSKIYVSLPVLFLSHGETSLTTVHCGLETEEEFPVDADWTVKGPSTVDLSQPSAPTSVFTLGVRSSMDREWFKRWGEESSDPLMPVEVTATPTNPLYVASSTSIIVRVRSETPVRFRKGEAQIPMPLEPDFAYRLIPPYDQFFGTDVQEQDGSVKLKLFRKATPLPSELLKETRNLQECYVEVMVLVSFDGSTGLDFDSNLPSRRNLMTIPIEVPCS